MSNPDFVYTTHIASTAEAVWKALTSTEFTRQYWSGSAVESDWQVGSPVVEHNPRGPGFFGEVLRAEPPRLLSYTFQTEDNQAAGHPATTVVFDIRPFGPEVVTLTVTHTEFPPGEAGAAFLLAISQGWPGILCSLKSLLESGRPLAFPSPFAPEQPAGSST